MFEKNLAFKACRNLTPEKLKLVSGGDGPTLTTSSVEISLGGGRKAILPHGVDD